MYIHCLVRYASVLFCIFCFTCVTAQNITFDNVPPITGGGITTGGGQAFNLTTSKAVTIQKIRGSFATTSGTVILWYNPSKINGQPSISAGNGWINLGSAAMTGTSASSTSPQPQTIPVNLNLVMYPSDTFGFFIQWTGDVYSSTNTSIPAVTNGTITFLTDASSAYTAVTGLTTWVGSRQLNGGVIYKVNAPVYNNASVSDLVFPGIFCRGSNQAIKVKVKNHGNNLINQVTLKWTLDGIAQSPVLWSAAIDTFGGVNPSDAVVTLGNVLFGSAGKTLKVWTEYPNATADITNADDTLTTVLLPSLTGAYTIGGTGADFATPVDAVNALNTYGICGPVTFNTTPGTGPYTTNLSFTNIKGSSPGNTIRFNGNGTTISNAANPVIAFSGASYITIDSFKITATGAGFGVYIGSKSHHLTLNRNLVTASTTSTANTSAGIVVSSSATNAIGGGNNAQYLTITNNEVVGGYYSLTLAGGSLVNNYGHYIANNIFRDFYSYGILLTYGDTVTIKNNNIHRAGRASVTSLNGIFCAYSRYVKINGNRLHDFGASSYLAYPLYLDNMISNKGYETEVSNNLIYNIGTTSLMYGIHCVTALKYVNFFHNTIQYDVPASNTGLVRGIFFATASLTNVYFKNNIINITGTGTGVKNGIYITGTPPGFYSNNNVIRVASSSSNNIGFWVSQKASLTDWTSASLQDSASVSADPVFSNLATGNLRPLSAIIDNMGAPSVISTDVAGYPRSMRKPDAGAYEFTTSNNNAGIDLLISPVKVCAGIHAVKATVINAGKNKINSLTINWSINGVLQTPASLASALDTLGSATGNSVLVTLGSTSVQATGSVLKIWTSLPNGQPDTLNLNDSVIVTAKPGMTGLVNIGSGGNYPTLASALSDLNYYGICGPVMMELQSNYSSAAESFPLTILQGPTATDSVVIRPKTGASSLVITGSHPAAIFDLDGAEHVTIDGRAGGVGAKALTISNTHLSGAVIRLVNGASGHSIRHLNIIGNDTAYASGVVFFSGTEEGSGNSNNLIDNCNINGNSSSANCIYSLGSAAPADNNNNTITNCNIFDFFTNVPNGSASGIVLLAGNNSWNIGTTGNGNNFYQTSVRSGTSTPALSNPVGFRGIMINHATVNGCNIIGNRIGGNIPGIAGSVFNIGITGTTYFLSNFVRAIDIMSLGSETATSVQGNIISDITVYSGNVNGAFAGIHILDGKVNTGNLAGNIIGSPTGNESIKIVYRYTSTYANIYGIRYSGSDGGLIMNNRIGAIKGTADIGSLDVAGILVSGNLSVPTVISGNIIGSLTTPNSIEIPNAPGNDELNGILLDLVTGSQVTITGNTVSNLWTGIGNYLRGISVDRGSAATTISGNLVSRLHTLSTVTDDEEDAPLIGIRNTATGAASHVISNNTVYGLVTLPTGTRIYVTGIYYGSTTTGTGNIIEKNRIYGLAAPSSSSLAALTGIELNVKATAKAVVSNNMITLGYDSSGASITAAHTITGISRTMARASFFHNSVRIGGTGVASASNNTCAFKTATADAGDSVYNNIFINTRTNATSGGYHLATDITAPSYMYSNYNLYYTPAPPLFIHNGNSRNTLADLKMVNITDTKSVSAMVYFASHADLHLAAGSIGDTILRGKTLANVPLDFDNQNRNTAYPYLGADEGNTPVPVKLSSFKAIAVKNNVLLQWTTAGESNASHFIIEASSDGHHFNRIGRVNAHGTSSSVNKYTLTHEDAQRSMNGSRLIYYRLTSVDKNESMEISGIETIRFDESKINAAVAYPNPFSKDLVLSIASGLNEQLSITITDITGRLTGELSSISQGGISTIVLTPLNDVEKGIYFIKVSTADGVEVIRVIKE